MIINVVLLFESLGNQTSLKSINRTIRLMLEPRPRRYKISCLVFKK
jgi:hypothetical protein